MAAELVEDLNLGRFCLRNDYNRGDFLYIDRRRLKRELRRLPKQRAAADARFQEQLRDLEYQRRTYGCEYYYRADGRMVSREDLLRIHELVEKALVRSIKPVADMSRPSPKR